MERETERDREGKGERDRQREERDQGSIPDLDALGLLLAPILQVCSPAITGRWRR